MMTDKIVTGKTQTTCLDHLQNFLIISYAFA